ncbi:MAG: Crp/Fnr family transcriptional regulator [Erysipelotrichaceae bacterium]|nr:Crp/Fnr family transcriptional regulator [Erysipelotrichaceae bacterium]
MNTESCYQLLTSVLNKQKLLPVSNTETTVYSDETFIHAGDDITSIFVLAKGTVRIKSFSTSGDNAIIASLSAPQILGITEFLQKMTVFGASVYADGICQVIEIPVELFHTTLMEYPDSYRILSPYLASLAIQNMNESESRLILNNRERLGLYLLNSCQSKAMPYYIRETREQIARNSHLNLRTLYRYIEEFISDGLLSRNRNKLYITNRQYLKLKNSFSKLV